MIVIYLDGCRDVKTKPKAWKRPIPSLYRTKPVPEKHGVTHLHKGSRKDWFFMYMHIASDISRRSDYIRLLRSSCILSISSDGDPTASLGNLLST